MFGIFLFFKKILEEYTFFFNHLRNFLEKKLVKYLFKCLIKNLEDLVRRFFSKNLIEEYNRSF